MPPILVLGRMTDPHPELRDEESETAEDHVVEIRTEQEKAPPPPEESREMNPEDEEGQLPPCHASVARSP